MSPVSRAFLSITAAALGLCSCSDDVYNHGIGSGIIEPAVTVDTGVRPGGDVTVPADIVTEPAQADFRIYVTDSDGLTSLWESNTASGIQQRLLPGVYNVSAIAGTSGAEGFSSPCFSADTTVTVTDGATTVIPLTARLANTLVRIAFDPSLNEAFASYSATVHSRSGHYCPYQASDAGPLFLRPGDITVSLDVALPDGRSANFNLIEIPSAEASTYYSVEIAASSLRATPSVTATASSGQTATVILSDDFLNARPPSLTASGFTSGVTLDLDEGAMPSETLRASVEANDLRHLILTGIAPTLGSTFATEIDLLDLTPAQADSLAFYGITMSGIDKGRTDSGTIDFTRVVTHLRYVPDAIPSTFSLVAVDGSGLVSQPLVLAVDIRPVDLRIESVSDAVIGIDLARMVVASSSPSLEGNLTVQAFDNARRQWTDLEITSIEPDGDPNLWGVTFRVPEGLDEVATRILYCDQERGTFTIGRVSPSYALEADPFALHARIVVEAEDPSMTGIVASAIQFFDESGARLPLVERNPSEGAITLSGLDPDKAYTLRTSLLPDPSDADFGPGLSFRTETASQLPNADFEDVRFRALVYKDMPSGGRYSQNTVEIYNRQNYTSFEHHLPKEWADVNSKTFNRAATNHNTWYLAPSTYSVTDAYSGAYAVRLDCVGYSLNGEPIPNYCQTTTPYTDYSLNVPQQFSRAAGRLFLGSYSFDAATETESYSEGVRFGSRPSALNGFYKFVASAANLHDNALVRVEVLGNLDGADVVIARGEMRLSTALSYTAFTIPLAYSRFGEKATSIRIMFAASDAIGDIESETREIDVSPFPASATLRGSSLWIDNLSFSY